jgi:hypothetical protein
MSNANRSEEEGKMSEIQSLISRVQWLATSVDRWNRAMLWGLVAAAIAAFWIVISTRLTVTRAKQLSIAQDELSDAKGRQLSLDLRDKDLRIAGLNRDSEALKSENLTLQSSLFSLQRQSESRWLTGEQKAKLSKLLSGAGENGAAIVSALMDGEASDFADDFDSSFQAAHWQTKRIKNLISGKFGVFVVTAEGTSLPRTKLLSDALTAVGIPHEVTTVKDGDASTSPAFQAGFLYLVIEHKPLPMAKNPRK